MILQALNQYYDRLAGEPESEIAPFGFSRQKIAYCVVVNPNGTLNSIEDVRTQNGKKQIPRPLLVCGDSKPPGSGINPCFLWDNAAYMLGYKPDDPKPERTLEAFAAFRERHLGLEKTFNDPAFSAVCRFLEEWNPASASENQTLVDVDTGFGLFRLASEREYVHERPVIRAWWLSQLAASDEPTEETVQGQCLVTGEVSSLARLHEPKIKGVAGAQSAGAAIVSFNLDAFESYGKKQSYNSPLSIKAAFQYCTALNYLLADNTHRVQIGDATVVFWTEQPSPAEDIFGVALGRPLPEDKDVVDRLEKTFKSIAAGKYPSELGDEETPFYILGLSPNAARISVRFWHVSTLGKLVENFQQLYSDLEFDYEDPEHRCFTIQDIVNETVPANSQGYPDKDRISPHLVQSVSASILNGTEFPVALLQQLLKRIQVEGFSDARRRKDWQRSRHRRAAILKAYLARLNRSSLSFSHQGDLTVTGSLDKLHRNSAYQCGRLFAALTFIQQMASKSVKANVARRFIAAASVSPALYLGRLQVAAEIGHLPKLDRQRMASYTRDLLKQINDQLGDNLPRRLDAIGQSMFMLGFYQQLSFLEKDGPLMNKLIRTVRGEWVRSKGEKILADLLSKRGIDYCYEVRTLLKGGPERIPDFFVPGGTAENDVYLEYLGGHEDGEAYDARWKQKVVEYKASGITEDGGPCGRLLVLDARTDIWDEPRIVRQLRDWFGPSSSDDDSQI